MTESVGIARWVAKKAGRGLFAAASRVVDPGRRSTTHRVRALMYHRVRCVERDPFSVTPEEFDEQMAWLAAEGIAVPLETVEETIAGRRQLSNDAVLITIDDGYRDVVTTALPILEHHRIPAVLFVTVAEVENRDGPPPAERAADAHVSWRELAALIRAGIAVGSHAWEHRSLARLPAGDAEGQIAKSRSILEQRLGIPVRSFAYPFGRRADHSASTRAALARSGYTCAFTAQHGAIAVGADPLTLPRVKVEGGEGLWMFRQLVAGGLDRWSVVDRYLWRLQVGEAARP